MKRLLLQLDATPMWLCSYQLLARMQKKGFGWVRNNGCGSLCMTSSPLRTFFLQYAGWIFGKHLSLPIKPVGSTFKAYQRCRLLQGSPTGVENVKKVMFALGSVRSIFGGL
jgi:hypothetical protein